MSGAGASLGKGQAPWFRMGRRYFRKGAAGVCSSLFDFAEGAEIDRAAAKAWLSLGYVPGDRTIFKHVDCLPGGSRFQVEDGDCVVTLAAPLRRLEKGHATVDAVFDAAVDAELSNGGHAVVPLSGGLDSRILLGALLERLPPKSITTITYGVPGTTDFELGNAVARQAGTKHHAVDLGLTHRWRREDVETVARLSDANNSLFHPSVWLKIRELLGRDGRIWTGYTGDGIGGAFSQRVESVATDPLEAFLRFELATLPAWSGKLDSKSTLLKELCATHCPMNELLGRTEAVWWANHVERYTTHHVFVHGVDYATPFMNHDVVRFFAGLDEGARAGKRVFDEWATRRWKRLFEIPTKDYGWAFSRRGTPVKRSLWQLKALASKAAYRVAPHLFVHPSVSYWHFEEELRTNLSLRGLVRELLAELDSAGLWRSAEWGPMLAAQDRGARLASNLLNGASLGAVVGMISPGK